MIESINDSKNDVSVAQADIEQVTLLGSSNKLASEQQDEENEAYNIAFSDEAWNVLGGDEEKKAENKEKEKDEEKDAEKGEKTNTSGKKELTEDEEKQVDELKKIDRKVRVHEQAHLSAAGGNARGGAQYTYVTGPDGKRYANGGHVNLDTSAEKDPAATIRKANTIRKAALAPADPSPADRKIAADAARMEAEAQKELSEQQKEET